MKIIPTLLVVLFVFTSCGKEEKKDALYPESTKENQTPEQLGQEIFESKGNCFACHKPDQKIVGPSIQQIAQIYKDKNGDIVSFLKGNEKPLVDPEQFAVMQTNFAITKNMTDEELKALEAYIKSFAK